MIGNIMNLEDGTFEEYFVHDLKKVSKDPVKNVRISVAKTLIKHLKKNGISCFQI
jgi:hypothetical protein